jgi:hypothetical protein
MIRKKDGLDLQIGAFLVLIEGLEKERIPRVSASTVSLAMCKEKLLFSS